MANEPDAGLKTSFYLLMAYAALFGVLSSLLAVGFITLYNQSTEFFEQVSLVVLYINIWVLLTSAGIFVGLVIRFFGQNGGLGVAQRQYAQNGRLNAKNLPGIMLQALIGLWSGAAVGPEGPPVFLTGGLEALSLIDSGFGKTMFRYLCIVRLLALLVVSLVHQSLELWERWSTCTSRSWIFIAT